MTKAFVFGKFLPFHKGHEAMIHFALAQCDWLIVLVCCSDRESIPGPIRAGWIKNTFSSRNDMRVEVFNYSEKDLPNTSESSEAVSAVWANIFKKLFPDYSIVVTSEPYGDFVAGFMGIRHISFDADKQLFPVSATAIRNDIFGNWMFLPEAVKPAYTTKVVILGTESTGKTTLAERLSKHYNCSCVLEAAREIIANSNAFSLDDLQLVAKEHAKAINRAVFSGSPLVIIDTDIHITQSYSKFVFGKTLDLSADIYNSNKADLYLYLNNDVEYWQDGTRLNERQRNALDISHREVLSAHNIDIVEISGDWPLRFAKAVEQIDRLLERKKPRY